MIFFEIIKFVFYIYLENLIKNDVLLEGKYNIEMGGVLVVRYIPGTHVVLCLRCIDLLTIKVLKKLLCYYDVGVEYA